MGRLIDFLKLAELSDDSQWIDSAKAQLGLVTEVFTRDTTATRSDTLRFFQSRVRVALLSGDTGAVNAALPAFLTVIDTTDYGDRMMYGWSMSSLFFEREIYDSALYYALRFIPPENTSISAEWRGVLYFKTGQYGEAVAELEHAAKRYDQARYENPFAAVLVHYYLGRTYEASGWTDEAIEQYEIFTDIWKDADLGITDLEDARARLARLKTES
jgi:tetratricopeptide (TPR) repeat protein